MLYPYKQGSQSAKALSDALGVKRIKLENSKFKGSPNKVVINWGASKVSNEVNKCKILNNPVAVVKASDKFQFFNSVDGLINIPEYTKDTDVASSWIEDGSVVIVREILNGHSGKGIVVLEDRKDFDTYKHNKAKLYVKYIPKKDEYRVHVVGKEVIDVRRKGIRNDVNKSKVNWKVRNYNNGFIFLKENVNPPKEVLEEAVKAVVAIGLDFGAVDIIWNNFRNKAFVLEINTAPGLEGGTVDNYAQAFKKFLDDEKAYEAQEYFRKKVNDRYKQVKFSLDEAKLDINDILEELEF